MRVATRSRPLDFALLILLAFVVQAAAGPLSAQVTQVASADRAAAVSDAPTFYGEVLPIIHENCATCHQDSGMNMGGNVAPFSLLTYDDARRRARMIASAVREGRMPPWSAADMHKGTFSNERILEDHEKATLIAWAEGGAPAGDPAVAPPVPGFLIAAAASNGWTRGEPDLIIEFNEEYCLDDDLRDIYVDLPATITADMLPEDRWIKSVEYRNGPAVHHIISAVGGLVPGAAPRVYDDGYSRVIRAGPRDVMFNMHFNKEPGPGTAVCTNIQAGIIFKEPGEEIRHVTGGDNLFITPRDLLIPAGASSHSASREYVFEEDVELLSFMPHMHLRGKAALYEITYPDGKHETLLHVPNYAFNWQHTYKFAEPPKIPAGSTLRFTLWWDNSENNPNNPDPTVDVKWGRPTDAEMSQGYMSFRKMEKSAFVVGDGNFPTPREGRRGR